VAANCGAVDHVLPVIGQPQFNKRFKQSVPDALLRPTTETDIEGILFTVAFMHVATGSLSAEHTAYHSTTAGCHVTVATYARVPWATKVRQFAIVNR
jgi:hypothetical protein